MASEVLMTISRNEAERARLMSEYKGQVDLQSKLVHAKREGIKIGEQKGIKTGQQKIVDMLKSGKSPQEIIEKYGS